ncbi:hypothetical protein RB2654_13930 [Rhodobacterales bacterium HTCC2654]|uniref:Uncharacterized protein n=1 Tax=Maritimibacter alkaliphilus HTCC2654 TaxID=314271 RepID=A3VGI5_9RHOB|nr:hypothetical protein RB2654_13930 [Rhodobacterales bacterium HTCC2654] [Maritimibacter alkaliphilus HTCC2654]
MEHLRGDRPCRRARLPYEPVGR